jgi:hypothetical protein
LCTQAAENAQQTRRDAILIDTNQYFRDWLAGPAFEDNAVKIDFFNALGQRRRIHYKEETKTGQNNDRNDLHY